MQRLCNLLFLLLKTISGRVVVVRVVPLLLFLLLQLVVLLPHPANSVIIIRPRIQRGRRHALFWITEGSYRRRRMGLYHHHYPDQLQKNPHQHLHYWRERFVSSATTCGMTSLSMGQDQNNDDLPLPTTTNNNDGINDQDCHLERYLLDCKESASSSQGYTTVTEKDRKTMVRTLLGKGKWTKSEFKAKLQMFCTDWQWKQTNDFISKHWDELNQIGQEIAARNADDITNAATTTPSFLDALYKYNHTEIHQGQSPRKLFSAMARGRIYQGKFERLLEDFEKLEWKYWYERYIGNDPEELSLIESFAEDYLQVTSQEDEDIGSSNDGRMVQLDSISTMRLVRRALKQEFPKAPRQPADGGKASGIQGELNLLTYLQEFVVPVLQTTKPGAEFRILGPVMLMNERKGRNLNTKKTPFTVELPPDVDLSGKTTELDAMIVELMNGDDDPKKIRVWQVWEAKATLHPMTIGDALRKKGQTLEYFTRTNITTADHVMFYIEGKGYSMDTENHDTVPALFGLFGKTILGHKSSVARLECALGESLLEKSVGAVHEALDTGRVLVSAHDVLKELDRLLALTRQFRATMVVRSELNKPTSS